MNTQLAVFDIDGTLTDSVALHQEAFVNALHASGFSDFDTRWGGYKHHTDSFIFKTIWEAQRRSSITVADLQGFEDLLYSYIKERTTAEPVKEIKGAALFLKGLRGFDIVFATGSLLKPARLKLFQAGIVQQENLIIAANEIFSREELVTKAITVAQEHFNVPQYDRIISFGDGRWDYETARNLNIDFIGIGNRQLTDYGVTTFYPDFAEITLLS